MTPRPSKTSNFRVCPPSHGGVAGLDVSHWDEKINWERVKAEDNHFTFIKASEGVSYVDKTFDRNWRDSKATGFLRGAYHFFRPKYSGKLQAELLLRLLASDPGELPPVLDFETHDGISNKTQIARAQEFLDVIEQALGRIPIIYCSPGFQNDLGNPQQFFRYPLWIANYGVPCPKVPPPWTTWQFWQDSEKGRIPGITTAVDINIFNGTLDQLKEFCQPSSGIGPLTRPLT